MDGDMLGPIISVLVIGWVVKISLAHRRFSKVLKIQAELQNKLLDKFASSQELAEYLRSNGGTAFMAHLRSAVEERTSPYTRIFASAQWGIVLAFGGGALLLIHANVSSPDEGMVVVGGLALALGLGFLVSGGVAFVLSKSWGLINGHDHGLDVGR